MQLIQKPEKDRLQDVGGIFASDGSLNLHQVLTGVNVAYKWLRIRMSFNRLVVIQQGIYFGEQVQSLKSVCRP